MRRLTRDPAELIPLKHSTYQVLLALGDGEAMHGYAIMQAVYYQRTSFGRAVARAESERLRALLDVARAQNMFGGPK